jgi:hypothetical protein
MRGILCLFVADFFTAPAIASAPITIRPLLERVDVTEEKQKCERIDRSFTPARKRFRKLSSK